MAAPAARRGRGLPGRGRRRVYSRWPSATAMYWRRAALVGTRFVRSGSRSAGRLEGAAGVSASGMGNSTSSSLGNTATTPMNQIQETISNNCVVIFSKTSCSYCTMAKKLFHDMNVNYKVVELDTLEHGSQLQDALHKMTGERTVPRIFVNGTFIGGATDIHRLHKEGRLLPLVQQCYLKKKQRQDGHVQQRSRYQ
ncbi:glutaredoxin 2 isoform X1 [Kogia breviceps]|uniref:glutaredoxin 2 isoform X1 n=1 Tax=Kogia breviceps TaxID=27615 RepID=UPI002795C8B6|nr:glutaredoxin 2 isoform X3 [Kogia breviceps]